MAGEADICRQKEKFTKNFEHFLKTRKNSKILKKTNGDI
jgi:hypothetical protein